MQTITATELKNNTASILGEVEFNKKEIIIEKHGKAVAKIVPVKTKKLAKSKTTHEKLKEFFGILPDFPTAEEIRNARTPSRELPEL